MPTTDVYGLRSPAGSDTRDVPRDLRYLALDTEKALQGVEAKIGQSGGTVTSGKLIDRPKAANPGALYIITGDADAGLVYLDDGTQWWPVGQVLDLLRVVSQSTTSVPLRVTAAAGQTSDLAQIRDSTGAALWRVTRDGRVVSALTPKTNLTYDAAGNLSTVVQTTADGARELSRQTLTYDAAGNLASIAVAADGRTYTRTLNYDTAGNLTGYTEA